MEVYVSICYNIFPVYFVAIQIDKIISKIKRIILRHNTKFKVALCPFIFSQSYDTKTSTFTTFGDKNFLKYIFKKGGDYCSRDFKKTAKDWNYLVIFGS